MAHVGTSVAALPAPSLLLPARRRTIAQAGLKPAKFYPKPDVNASVSEQHLGANLCCAGFVTGLQFPSRGGKGRTRAAFLPAPLMPHRPRVQAGAGGAPGTQRKHGYALMANSFRAVSGISYMLNQDKEDTIQPQTIHIGAKTCFRSVGTPSTGKGGSVSTRLIQELAPLWTAA